MDGTEHKQRSWRGAFPLFWTMYRRGKGLPVRWLDIPDGIASLSPRDPTWSDSNRTFRISLHFDPGFGLIRWEGFRTLLRGPDSVPVRHGRSLSLQSPGKDGLRKTAEGRAGNTRGEILHLPTTTSNR